MVAQHVRAGLLPRRLAAQSRAQATRLGSTSRSTWISRSTSACSNTPDPLAVKVGERALVQKLRVHDAARGEVIDNEVEEFVSERVLQARKRNILARNDKNRMKCFCKIRGRFGRRAEQRLFHHHV